MTFLFVNLIYHPTSKLAENDQKLAEMSMLQLQKYFDYKGLEKFKQLRHVLVQIGSVAESVLKEARISQAPKESAQSISPFEAAPFPSVSPPLDVFDMNSGQDLVSSGPLSSESSCVASHTWHPGTRLLTAILFSQTSEEPVPPVGLGWMGQRASARRMRTQRLKVYGRPPGLIPFSSSGQVEDDVEIHSNSNIIAAHISS